MDGHGGGDAAAALHVPSAAAAVVHHHSQHAAAAVAAALLPRGPVYLFEVGAWLVPALVATWFTLFVLWRVVFPRCLAWYPRAALAVRIEGVMRANATIFGSSLSFLALHQMLSVGSLVADLPFYQASIVVAVSYYFYDTTGNLFYYRLLRKNFVLFHHCLITTCAVCFAFFYLNRLGAIGSLSLFTDVYDHLFWFLRAKVGQERGPFWIGVHLIGTALFFLLRIVVTNAMIVHMFLYDPYTHAASIAGLIFCVFLVITFDLMNVYVLMLKVHKTRSIIRKSRARRGSVHESDAGRPRVSSGTGAASADARRPTPPATGHIKND